MTPATMPLHATDETHTPEPPKDCPLCPRLVGYRNNNKAAHPDWVNGAVSSFGRSDARLLIVGLAPGLKGANRTGRPFLGDYAGELLYGTLLKVGLAHGQHDLVASAAQGGIGAETACLACAGRARARGLHDLQCGARRASRQQTSPRRDRNLPPVSHRTHPGTSQFALPACAWPHRS